MMSNNNILENDRAFYVRIVLNSAINEIRFGVHHRKKVLFSCLFATCFLAVLEKRYLYTENNNQVSEEEP